MKKLILLLMGIFLISLVGAATLGTFQQNKCVNLIQTCDNCSYVNVTSIQFPNSTIYQVGYNMTKNSTFYNYTFCINDAIGTYIYNTCGDDDGILTCVSVDYEITPSGQEKVNPGQGISLFGAIVSIMIIGTFFFITGFKVKNIAAKILFISLASITFIIIILFTLVILTQNLGGYPVLIEGYSTFWFVMKILVSISMLSLVLYAGLVAFRLWQFKKGYKD